MTKKENTYWKTIKNSLYTAECWADELIDLSVHVHFGESALVGVATALAMRKGNIAARYLIPKNKMNLQGRPFRAVTSLANASVGIAATSLTSYGLTTKADKEHLTSRIVHAPLMPTQSLSSDLFCDKVIEECKKNSGDEAMSPETRKFAECCQLRRNYERKLRKEQGLDPSESVDIPFLGVPTNDPLDEYVINVKARYIEVEAFDAFKLEQPYNTEEMLLHSLQEIFNDYKPAFIMGISSFLFLRKVPHRLFSRLRPILAGLANRRSDYILEQPKRSILFRGAKLGYDTFLSVTIFNFCFAYWFCYTGRFARSTLESPLVAGRSTVSDEMCNDVVKEYQHMQSTLAKSEYQSLRHLSVFVHNCQRRQEEEQKLRLIKGLPKDAKVLLPQKVSGGITRNDVDKAWAESMVKDREELEHDVDNDTTSKDSASKSSSGGD